MEQILSTIGSNLHKLRHSKEQKLETVAKAIGVKHSVISKIEHGRYECLNLRLLLKLANYFEVPITDLLSPCS
jgi:transcriptional regulator with XRE-family HTH domain